VRNAPPLGTLAWLVTRDANKTIGSGMASIELLRRTLERRGWLDDREHGVLNAVARFTPGTNVLAYLAALGWSYHGAAGATLVAAGLVLANAWSLVRPHVRGARVGWALGSAALAAALYLAGATPVRVLLALAIWGALTPSDAPPRTEKHAASPR